MKEKENNNQNLPAEENSSSVTDIFDDLAKLTIAAQDVVASDKILTVLPVRKPKRDEWIRTHGELAVHVNLYTDESDRSVYLVAAAALEPMADLVKQVRLTLTQSYDGQTFVWPVAIPAETKSNPWHASGWQAAELAAVDWVRVSAGSGQYDVHRRPSGKRKDPKWPSEIESTNVMLRFAFGKSGGGELIATLDHPVIQRVLGKD